MLMSMLVSHTSLHFLSFVLAFAHARVVSENQALMIDESFINSIITVQRLNYNWLDTKFINT